MIMNFHPWEIDVDVDATRQFYEENDCAEDRDINQKFYDKMSQAQKDFFASIGVDIQKIKRKKGYMRFPARRICRVEKCT